MNNSHIIVQSHRYYKDERCVSFEMNRDMIKVKVFLKNDTHMEAKFKIEFLFDKDVPHQIWETILDEDPIPIMTKKVFLKFFADFKENICQRIQ